MPFGRCPICGATYHLSVSLPVDEWYRQYWPQLRAGDEIPDLCPRCGIDLRPGHRVAVRSVPIELAERVTAGISGVVVSVSNEVQPLYEVELEGAGVAKGRFLRSELFYILGQHRQD